MDGTPRDTQPKDSPFDPAKTPASEAMGQLVTEVLARLAAVETRLRRRQAPAQLIHDAAVTALVCDLVHRTLSEPEGWLTVELSKAELSPKTRRAPFMTEQFCDLVKALASPEVAVVELRLGHWTPAGGLRSTIRASSWLQQRTNEMALFYADIGRSAALLGDPLVLRSAKVNGEAEDLPVPDTALAHQLRAEMVEINDWLSRADIGWAGCEVTDGVDLGERHLQRIFNDGSLERGGRLFHGFWQGLKKEGRKELLRINGLPVASVDFAQMSVRLAYAQVGAQPPEGDLYRVYGVGGSREGVKKVMNALLASDKLPKRMPQGTRTLFPAQVSIADVIEALSRRHPELLPLFGTSQALIHQNIESRVIVRALLRLKELGIVALPIHDCLLVSAEDVYVTEQILESTFEEVTGVRGKVEVDLPLSVLTKGSSGAPLKEGA